MISSMHAVSTHTLKATPATRRAHTRQPAKAEADIGRRTVRILLRTARAFFSDNIAGLGAALAFYTTVAVAPMLVLAVAAAGIFLDETAARQQIINEIEHLAGAQATAVVQTVQNPMATTTGTLATIGGLATLMFGTFGVFQHLQDALNAIWRVQPKPTKGWWEFAKYRLFSLATVVATGFLLMVSLIVSSVLSWGGAQVVKRLGWPVFSLQIVDNILSLGAVTLLFALIFKLLPDTFVRWRDVWLGAFATAVLFTIGKSVLGLYLGRASITSAYGAAGSLVALLLWCYYAAQIVFLGAEFTRVASMSRGGRDFSPLEAKGERVRHV